MSRLQFTQQLKRFTDVPEIDTSAASLREALEQAFALNPRLRAYVLDDQGHLRANVVIYIDGRTVRNRERLDDEIAGALNIHVLQALSGG